MKRIIGGLAAAALLLGTTGSMALADKDDGKNLKMTEEWGFKRPGKTLREMKTGDLEKCKELCLENSQCKAYVYRTGSGECALKYEKGSKERDNNRVTGVKVPRTGAEDKDDYGQWGKADKVCREEVANKFNVPKQGVRLEYDESFENKVRFQWKAAQNRGTCEATEGGRITDFNSRNARDDGGKGSAGAGAAAGGAVAMDKKAKDDDAARTIAQRACGQKAAAETGLAAGDISVSLRKTEKDKMIFDWSGGGKKGTCKTDRNGKITGFEKAAVKKQAK